MNLNSYSQGDAVKTSYPCLKIGTADEGRLIVLFIGSGAGVIMSTECRAAKSWIGTYRTDWNEALFAPFHGRVIIGTDIPQSLGSTHASAESLAPQSTSRDDFTGEQLRAAYNADGQTCEPADPCAGCDSVGGDDADAAARRNFEAYVAMSLHPGVCEFANYVREVAQTLGYDGECIEIDLRVNL